MQATETGPTIWFVALQTLEKSIVCALWRVCVCLHSQAYAGEDGAGAVAPDTRSLLISWLEGVF